MLAHRITNRELDSEGKVVLSGSLSDEDKEWIWRIENAIDQDRSFFMPWKPGEYVWCAMDDQKRIALRQMPGYIVPTHAKRARVNGYELRYVWNECNPSFGQWVPSILLDLGFCEQDQYGCSERSYGAEVVIDGWIGTEKSDLDPILKMQTDQTVRSDQ